MPQYTVKDSKTGKTITFQWNGDKPPTQADMEEVFSSAAAKQEVPTGQRIFEKVVAPTIEFGAMGAGALLGAPVAPPLGGVGGAGLGYAGGRQVTDILSSLLGYKKPGTLPEQAQQAVGDIATGAGSEMLGGIGGKIFSKLFMKSPQVSAEQAARKALGEQTGVKLSPADITEQKSTAIIESALEKNVGSTNIARTFREEQMRQVETFAQSQLAKQGGPLDMLTAGAQIQEKALGRQLEWEKLYKPVYNRLNQLIPKNTMIDTPTMDIVANEFKGELSAIKHETVTSILDKITKPTGEASYLGLGLGPYRASGRTGVTRVSSQAKELQSYLNPAGNRTPDFANPYAFPKGEIPTAPNVLSGGVTSKQYPIKEWSWSKVDQTQKKLGDLIGESLRSGKNYEASIYTQLKKALDEDISLFAERSGGDIKGTYDLAKSLFKSGQGDVPGANIFRNKTISKNILESTKPETIVNTFIKPNNPSNIALLSKTLGKDGMQPVKQAWLEKLFIQGPEQSFSPSRFATSWYKYDKQTLRQFMDSDEIAGLDQLAKVSRVLQTAEKIAGNPSGTGQTLGTLSSVWLWIKHPVLMSSIQLGSGKFADLYFNNPTWRKWFIEGLKAPPGSDRAAKALTMITSLAYQRNYQSPGEMVGQAGTGLLSSLTKIHEAEAAASRRQSEHPPQKARKSRLAEALR